MIQNKRVYRKSRLAPYTRGLRSQLPTVNVGDQRAFNRWLDANIKDSKHSKQTDLPSSQLPDEMSQIDPSHAQLFAVLDTCSIVRSTIQFMDYVINLKRSFPKNSPIKFIISLTVLEELDKCNRPTRKKPQQQQQLQGHCEEISLRERDQLDPPIGDLLHTREPPRSFMRFIEEEVRAGQILIGQLDPFKTIKIPPFEIINKDDRILECCLRGAGFIKSQPHHPDTRLILITEDNIFKTKATTFGVPSFRWREFEAKYHNFGRNNCVPTPLLPTKTNRVNDNPPIVKIVDAKCAIKQQTKSDVPKQIVRKILGDNLTKQSQSDDITFIQEVITIDTE